MKKIKFLPIEILTLIYIFVSAILIFLIMPEDKYVLLMDRAMFTIFILSFASIYRRYPTRKLLLLRNLFIGLLLIYWYPETFYFNKGLVNHDAMLARWDQYLFGLQPALWFQETFSSHEMQELMSLGYFSLFPMIAGTSIYLFIKNKKYCDYYLFTLFFSFYAFYLIFNVFPASGPQYYFKIIGFENAKSGIFPEIGTYFNDHFNPLKKDDSGFFSWLMEKIQSVGERPTAAFPSSHIGISTLIILVVLKLRKYNYFLWIFPFYVILVVSTVYLQAHYVVDVIAGLVSAFVLFGISSVLYNLFYIKPEIN